MAVRITVSERSPNGPDTVGEVRVLDQEVITIGRDPSCEVVLAKPAVSRSHARILREGTLFFIEDLGSATGTELNGTPLRRGERSLLHQGDAIAIASFELAFSPMGAPSAVAESTSVLARQAVREVVRGLSPGDGPHLRILNGPHEGERIALGQAEELIIGREPGVHVLLEGDLVSRRHARLRREWDGTHLEDLGSRNGIRVNRKRVARETLADRDEIEVGNIRMLFIDPTATRQVSLESLEASRVKAGTAAGDNPSDARPAGSAMSEPDGAIASPDSRTDTARFIPLAVAAVCAVVALAFLALVAAGL
jgi:pSer/pThr/pTyr-binding forkhead associated (FHA) protein